MIYILLCDCFSIENSSELITDILKNGLTIFIALIAATFALFQARSNTISAARIQWIESLKLSISELYSASLEAKHYYDMAAKSVGPELNLTFNKYETSLTKCNILSNKIILNLNSKEDNHKKLESLINIIDELLSPLKINKTSQEEIESNLKKVIILSKIIFKLEWDKSKKIFFWLKIK